MAELRKSKSKLWFELTSHFVDICLIIQWFNVVYIMGLFGGRREEKSVDLPVTVSHSKTKMSVIM